MTDCLTMPTSIDLASGEARPVVRSGNRHLCELRVGSATEQRAADFIRRRFQQAYGARPNLQLPPLVALVSGHGTLLAAVGVRSAAAQRLFLEDYLDAPVEACLPEACASRNAVVEIAHLAGVESGISRPLFASLAVWLRQSGWEWVVCTGTTQLRNGFRQIGIGLSDLGAADPARLVGAARSWGTYYQCQPRVLAINVPQSVDSLRAAGLLRQVESIERSASAAERALPTTGGGYGHTA